MPVPGSAAPAAFPRAPGAPPPWPHGRILGGQAKGGLGRSRPEAL